VTFSVAVLLLVYMNISDREEKERDRMKKDRPGLANRWQGMGSTDPMRVV